MGFYSKFVFPRFYDCLMDRPCWAKHRRAQLASVSGEILEIGVGTGLNLPHYPDHVKKITTADPNAGMNQQFQRRIDHSGIEVDRQLISSESLPFGESAFDCVVSTLTLCSIPDVRRAMAELYRVLKPGGRVLFLEHGLSPNPQVAKWQRRLDWIQRRVGDGCTLTLEVPELFLTQPFASVQVDNFYLEEAPPTHGYMFHGVATK